MKKFYQLNCDNIIDYVQDKIEYFNKEAELTCEEIGDGNLNLIFRIRDNINEKSIIVKQALPYLRCVGESWPLNITRNDLESGVLTKQYELTHGMVPKIYYSDGVMHSVIMEDLHNYNILRGELLNLKQFHFFSERITNFLVKTLLYTSDIIMEHKEKKEMVKKFMNPELCEITERLVFTEPYYRAESNNIDSYLVPFMSDYIWNDKELLNEIAKLKLHFMNSSEALIHGDLHTGSIFINNDDIKVIDPEFAFYGPISYDLGVLIANLIMNYESVDGRYNEISLKRNHLTFLSSTIKDIIDLFKEKFFKEAEGIVNDNIFKLASNLLNEFIDNIISNAAGMAGCEMIRRTVGLAHVEDLDSIEDEKIKKMVRMKNILLGKELIMKKNTIKVGQDIINLLGMFTDLDIILKL